MAEKMRSWCQRKLENLVLMMRLEKKGRGWRGWGWKERKKAACLQDSSSSSGEKVMMVKEKLALPRWRQTDESLKLK